LELNIFGFLGSLQLSSELSICFNVLLDGLIDRDVQEVVFNG
jgi:hypothetical protein